MIYIFSFLVVVVVVLGEGELNDVDRRYSLEPPQFMSVAKVRKISINKFNFAFNKCQFIDL